MLRVAEVAHIDQQINSDRHSDLLVHRHRDHNLVQKSHAIDSQSHVNLWNAERFDQF